MSPPKKSSEQASSEDGIQALLIPQVSHDHFPVLETIFERFCYELSTSIHNLTAVNVDVAFLETKTLHFGKYLEEIPEPSILGIFHAEEWDNESLLVLTSSLVRPLLELMLGGQLTAETKKKVSPEENTFTLIERHLTHKLLQSFLDTLGRQFSAVTPVKFTLGHVESSTRSVVIVRETSPCIVAYFKLQVDSIQSVFQIVFPYTTIQPVRSLLSESFLGEKMGKDSLWVDHINHELPQTHVLLEAILDDVSLPLQDVLKWAKGTSFYLKVTPDSSIQVKCRGEPVFWAKMGQKQGRLALLVEEVSLKNPPVLSEARPEEEAQSIVQP